MVAEEAVEQAVVTAVIPYGETDAIVRLFTRGQGRLGAFVRGARAGRKKQSSAYLPLSVVSARLQKRRSGDLYTLHDLEVTQDPTPLGQDPVTYGRASYLVELTERLLGDGEQCPDYFDLLQNALARFAAGSGDARLLRAFELKLLGHTGYLPDLGSAWDAPGAPVAYYDPHRGRLLARATTGAVAFDEDARQMAVRLCGADLHVLPEVDDATLRHVSRIFALHLRSHGVTNLKTVAYLKSLANPMANLMAVTNSNAGLSSGEQSAAKKSPVKKRW